MPSDARIQHLAMAWHEYGTPEELPNIYHRKEYEADLDRLQTADSRASSWTGRTGAREWRASGFSYIRRKGKNHCVMRKVIP